MKEYIKYKSEKNAQDNQQIQPTWLKETIESIEMLVSEPDTNGNLHAVQLHLKEEKEETEAGAHLTNEYHIGR